MSTKSITGTGLLLAVALLAQSLRSPHGAMVGKMALLLLGLHQ